MGEDKIIPIYSYGDICTEIDPDPNDPYSGRIIFVGDPFIVDGLVFYHSWIGYPNYDKKTGKEGQWAISAAVMPEYFLVNVTKRVKKSSDYDKFFVCGKNYIFENYDKDADDGK